MVIPPLTAYTTRMNVIEIRGLNKHFGTTQALKDVTLNVPEGEIFGFLGPNGAGKSTTIRCLMDFIRPTSGTIRILDRNARTHSTELKNLIGYVPAELNLYAGWTVDDHIRFVERVRGAGPSTARKLKSDLALVGDSKIQHLSTGNQQKLAIILALIGSPKLLILDEPTRGLDPLLQASLHDLLRHYRENGGSIFLSSHNLPEVAELCTGIAVIRAGKIITSATLESLTHGTLHSFHVIFAETPPSLYHLKPKNLTTQNRSVHFETDLDVNMVLRELGRHQIKDIEISHPSLEQIFMEMYQS